jgi:hypothetical protein
MQEPDPSLIPGKLEKYDRKSLECCALWILLGPWEGKKDQQKVLRLEF